MSANAGQFPAEVVKFATILLLGVSVGVFSTLYSPFVALAGAIVFALLTFSLYVSSHARPVDLIAGRPVVAIGTEPQHNLLFYLCFLSFFLSITIPKSGKTVANIPITVANMLILFTLICWLLTSFLSRKTFVVIPLKNLLLLFILYGAAVSLIGLVNDNQRKYVILDFVAFMGFIPIYFLVCYVVRTPAHLRKIVWAIGLSSFLVCSYGLLQTKFSFDLIALPGITEQSGKIMYEGVGRWNVVEGGAIKVYSTFQNGNIFGNHLATFIPFLGGILIGPLSARKKIVPLGVFLLSCYVLILTYSRGALVGTLTGMILLAIISKKIRLKAIIVMLLIFAILIGFVQQYSDRPELTRYDFRRIAANPDQFSAGRVERAKEVLKGFANLPLTAKIFGIGFGGVLTSPSGGRFGYVDNLYLTLLFKMGLVGLAMLFAVLIRFFRTLLQLRLRVSDLYLRGLINGGIAGLFASLTHNLADTLWFFPPLSANFWFLAGITMAIAMLGARQPQPVEAATRPRNRPPKAKAIRPRFVSA